MAEKRYRVVCTSGHAYDVAVWLDGDTRLARMHEETPWSGEDERAAVIAACLDHIDIAEVRAPGELTAAELVAAERQRCVDTCRSVAASCVPWSPGAEACAAEIQRGGPKR